MIVPQTTSKRMTKREAYRRAVVARAEVLRIPVDLCRIGIKHLRVDDYLALEARAKEAAAYEAMTGDRVGAVLAATGTPWPVVIEGLAERQRECTCNGLSDACRACLSRADHEAELPFEQ